MKKSIFILAALLAATVANAQITLLHSFDGGINISINNNDFGRAEYIEAPYFFESDQDNNNDGLILNLYEKDDFSLYKSIHITNIGDCGLAELVSKNIFTTDNKICFMVVTGDGKRCIYNEDGQIVKLFEYGYGYSSYVVRASGKYMLILSGSYGQGSYIYSLPGNNEPQDVETPAAPRSSARKVLKRDQVQIESEDHIFDTQGKMLR